MELALGDVLEQAAGVAVFILIQGQLEVVVGERAVGVVDQAFPQKSRLIGLLQYPAEIVAEGSQNQMPDAADILAAHPLHLPVDVYDIIVVRLLLLI